jgi:hypothetical protein
MQRPCKALSLVQIRARAPNNAAIARQETGRSTSQHMRAWRNRQTHRTQNATGNTRGGSSPSARTNAPSTFSAGVAELADAPGLNPGFSCKFETCRPHQFTLLEANHQTNEDHHDQPAQTRGPRDPERTKPGSAGHGTFNPAAGGSSPPGFTNHRPVAERFSGGFLIRVNAGSIPAGSTNYLPTKCAGGEMADAAV